jgi:hypothetical protein
MLFDAYLQKCYMLLGYYGVPHETLSVETLGTAADT